MNSALAIQQIQTSKQTSKRANSFQIKPISLAVMRYANKKHWKKNEQQPTIHKRKALERETETAYALIRVRSRHIAVCNSLSVVASCFFFLSSFSLISFDFYHVYYTIFRCGLHVFVHLPVCMWARIIWISNARMDARAFYSLSRRHYTRKRIPLRLGEVTWSVASIAKPSKVKLSQTKQIQCVDVTVIHNSDNNHSTEIEKWRARESKWDGRSRNGEDEQKSKCACISLRAFFLFFFTKYFPFFPSI